MSLIAYGLIALALLGAVGTGVNYVKEWGADEVRAEWNLANETARKREAEASAKAAADLEAERKKRKVVVKERTVFVDREIEKLVTSTSCISPLGVSTLNSAINGKSADRPKPDLPMPAPRPPG